MVSETPVSIWNAVSAPAPDLTALHGDMETDVVVIGAGFTGLSTALHLTEDNVDVVVLEAVEPGWGASGRNNGQVIPTLTRPNPDDIIAKHGAAGERFVDLLRDSADYLFDVTRRYQLNAEAEQTGWIQPVHTPGRMKLAEDRVRQWSKHGAPVELLSPEQVRDLTGSELWHSGWTNPTGGHVNPLALTRELARCAVEAGARIFVKTPAHSMKHDGRKWIVETPSGRVTADRLMLATNAYTDEFSKTLAPDISREVVPKVSWQLATKPLGDNLRRHIIPGRQAVSDTHGDLYFTRYDARHRLITGGALIIPINGQDRMKARLAKRLKRMFTSIGDVEFEFVWSGNLGMTTDFMPRFHQLGPNGYAWVGCNGRGVALSIALGREFSRALQGADCEELGLPFSDPKPLPGHSIVRRLAPLRLVQYRWNDAREI